MSLFVQVPSGSLKYTFEWADIIPQGVALGDAIYDLDGLTLDSNAIDNAGQTSTVQLSGVVHGGLYIVTATAVLSNGERVPDQQLIVRGFNSGSTAVV